MGEKSEGGVCFFRNRVATRLLIVHGEAKVLPCSRCFWSKLPSGICDNYKLTLVPGALGPRPSPLAGFSWAFLDFLGVGQAPIRPSYFLRLLWLIIMKDYGFHGHLEFH